METQLSGDRYAPLASAESQLANDSVVTKRAILTKEWQVFLISGFLDYDKDVLCLVGACKAARLCITLLHRTGGAIYFGEKGSYGLWRHQSLQMVSASCCMWSKLEFVDDCKLETPELVELCVATMQKVTYYAKAPCKYFLVTMNEGFVLPYISSLGLESYRIENFAFISSLGFGIWMVYDRDGLHTYFQRYFEDRSDDEEFEREVLAPYEGVAALATNKDQAIRIPSDYPEGNALEAMRLRPSFVIAIWTPDIKTGYFNSGDLHSADGMWFRMPNGMAVQPQLLRPYHSHL